MPCQAIMSHSGSAGVHQYRQLHNKFAYAYLTDVCVAARIFENLLSCVGGERHE